MSQSTKCLEALVIRINALPRSGGAFCIYLDFVADLRAEARLTIKFTEPGGFYEMERGMFMWCSTLRGKRGSPKRGLLPLRNVPAFEPGGAMLVGRETRYAPEQSRQELR